MGTAPRWPSGSAVYKVADSLNFKVSATIPLAVILPGYASYTSNDFVVSLKSGQSPHHTVQTGRCI